MLLRGLIALLTKLRVNFFSLFFGGGMWGGPVCVEGFGGVDQSLQIPGVSLEWM